MKFLLNFIIFSFVALNVNFSSENGYTMGFWESGTMTYGMCVVVANLKILMFSNLFNFLNLSIMVLSLLTYLLSLIVISEIKVSEVYYLFNR